MPIVPTTPRVEKHFTGSESVRAVVIGMADGLTRAVRARRRAFGRRIFQEIIVMVGLAEIVRVRSQFALADVSRTDQEHHQSEERREYAEVDSASAKFRKWRRSSRLVRNAHHPFQIEQECDRARRRCLATYWLFLKSNRAAYEPEEHLQGAGAVRLPLVIRRATSASRQLLSRR